MDRDRATRLIYQPVEPDQEDQAFIDAVVEVARRTEELRLVSPYLGEPVLAALTTGRRFRLVTDLSACFEANAGEALVELLERHASSVRDLPLVHAKVVLGDEAALVGSANLTRRAFEERAEMACLLRDEALLQELSRWFDALWEHARPPGDIRQWATRARAAQAAHPRPAPDPQRARAPRRGTLGSLLSPAQSGRGAPTPPSEPTPVDPGTQDDVARTLRRLTRDRAEAALVLGVLRDALLLAGLPVDDERLHLGVGEDHLNITIGQRHVAWCKRAAPRRGGPYLVLALDDFAIAHQVQRAVPECRLDEFTAAGQADAPIVKVPVARGRALPPAAWESWRHAVVAQVQRAGKSGYRRHKRPALYPILTQAHLLRATIGMAFPQGWWFGVNNGSKGHMHLDQVLPFLRGEVQTLKWRVANSKPKRAYSEMLPGDPLLVWTGHGRDPAWGLIGTAVLAEVHEDHVVLRDGERFATPLTPYAKGQPQETATVRFLLAQLGGEYTPLGDVRRAVHGTPRRPPVTVAPVPLDVLERILARARPA